MARRNSALVAVAVVLLLVTGIVVLLRRQEPLPDYTNVSPEELGVTPLRPRIDPGTSFANGGKNATSVIRGLKEINGRAIADLEKDMRPGVLSEAGFLGRDESLLEVLAEDNQYVVERLGLTHQELAKHLHVLGAIGTAVAIGSEPEKWKATFVYHGARFRVEVKAWTGKQESPFLDDTETAFDATVLNLDNGAKLGYSCLLPFMIERYGFYEGKGTPYRVEPRRILEVLTFLKSNTANADR